MEPVPESLATVARLDLTGLDPRLAQVDLAIACDVDNPLLGAQGAAAVYGPQKGATPADVAFLDDVLARLADAMAAATARDVRSLPGAGAAGGARLERGVALVAQVRGLAAHLAGADWCFTGEGRIDAQTLHGKVVDGVAALARAAQVGTIAFGGSLDPAAEGALRARGVRCVPILSGPSTLADAMRDTAPNLRAAAARITPFLGRS